MDNLESRISILSKVKNENVEVEREEKQERRVGQARVNACGMKGGVLKSMQHVG